jgi:hypothetical protein
MGTFLLVEDMSSIHLSRSPLKPSLIASRYNLVRISEMFYDLYQSVEEAARLFAEWLQEPVMPDSLKQLQLVAHVPVTAWDGVGYSWTWAAADDEDVVLEVRLSLRIDYIEGSARIQIGAWAAGSNSDWSDNLSSKGGRPDELVESCRPSIIRQELVRAWGAALAELGPSVIVRETDRMSALLRNYEDVDASRFFTRLAEYADDLAGTGT